MGNQRRCRCGEKETTKHIVNEGERIQLEWLTETADIRKIRKINEWIEKYFEEREGEKMKKS